MADLLLGDEDVPGIVGGARAGVLHIQHLRVAVGVQQPILDLAHCIPQLFDVIRRDTQVLNGTVLAGCLSHCLL